ncbi:hypothetical protein FACS189491_01050 [Spirochaetia bacterium]|nr:hypothetical protein FACS189491_01050 [Spirochaetia bacterium]
MKNRISCVLLSILIITIVILPGCKSRQVKQGPGQTNELSNTSLTPLTREIIQLAREGGVDIKDFQYVISTTIELTNERNTRTIEIDKNGTVLVRNLILPQKIIVKKETSGKYITTLPNPEDPTVFEICFDKEDEKKTLFFMESRDKSHFDLKLYTEEPQTVKYGGEMYDLSFPDSSDPIPPQLFIRFDERTLNISDTRVAPGRRVNPK